MQVDTVILGMPNFKNNLVQSPRAGRDLVQPVRADTRLGTLLQSVDQMGFGDWLHL